MKLTRHESNPPPRNPISKGPSQAPLQDQQTHTIEQPQHTPDYELCMLEANHSNKGLAESRKEYRAEKSPWHGTGEGEVIIGAGKAGVDVVGGGAIDEDVVGRLEVEGFLDFGVGGNKEMKERDEKEKRYYGYI